MFKETLYQLTATGKSFVACLEDQGVYPGIKVDEGLQPLEGGLEGETWTKGLESLAANCSEYFKAGAKWVNGVGQAALLATFVAFPLLPPP